MPATVDDLNMAGENFAVTAEWGHSGSADAVTSGLGRAVERAYTPFQLSAIRDLDDEGFDVLAAVLFDGVYRIVRAALIPVDVVRRRSTYIDRTSSHRFMLQDNVWNAPQVIDATARLRAIL